MNAVIYARYSSDNQREESIEGQLRECKVYAERNDLTIVGTYIDRALSAKTDSRPEFQRMIKNSNTKKFEIVLVWKLDRFSRNRYDSAIYKKRLKKNGVSVVSATENISPTPEGQFMESILEGYAEFYSAELAQKVARGEKDNALKSKFNGGISPLGYKISAEQHYEIEPTEASIVKEIFERYADGDTTMEIVNSLNQRGLRTRRGNPFRKNSLQTMLKNRRYLGEYRYKDTVTPDAFPAIIDEDLFARVQQRCEKNKQAPARTKTEVNFILTTKLFCGKCGKMMAGESGTSKTGTTYYYYKCGNHKRNGTKACDMRSPRKDALECFVVKKAVETILIPGIVDELIEKLLIYQSKENTRLPVLRKELNEVEKRLKNLVDAIEQGIFTSSTKQRLDELEERRSALNVSILQEEIEQPVITKEQMEHFFDHFRTADLNDKKAQQIIVDCLVNSVYVFEDKILINFNSTDSNGEMIKFEEVNSSVLEQFGAPDTKTLGVCPRFLLYRLSEGCKFL